MVQFMKGNKIRETQREQKTKKTEDEMNIRPKIKINQTLQLIPELFSEIHAYSYHISPMKFKHRTIPFYGRIRKGNRRKKKQEEVVVHFV